MTHTISDLPIGKALDLPEMGAWPATKHVI